MKPIFMIVLCLALLSAGCTEQRENGSDSERSSSAGSAVDSTPEKVTVDIISPRAGEIIQGDEDFAFDATAMGSEGDLSYEWSSSIDGLLSASRSFNQNPADLSKGGHVIILKVTDERGNTGQGSVQVEVI